MNDALSGAEIVEARDLVTPNRKQDGGWSSGFGSVVNLLNVSRVGGGAGEGEAFGLILT
jgi:hypothetical protein